MIFWDENTSVSSSSNHFFYFSFVIFEIGHSFQSSVHVVRLHPPHINASLHQNLPHALWSSFWIHHFLYLPIPNGIMYCLLTASRIDIYPVGIEGIIGISSMSAALVKQKTMLCDDRGNFISTIIYTCSTWMRNFSLFQCPSEALPCFRRYQALFQKPLWLQRASLYSWSESQWREVNEVTHHDASTLPLWANQLFSLFCP